MEVIRPLLPRVGDLEEREENPHQLAHHPEVQNVGVLSSGLFGRGAFRSRGLGASHRPRGRARARGVGGGAAARAAGARGLPPAALAVLHPQQGIRGRGEDVSGGLGVACVCVDPFRVVYERLHRFPRDVLEAVDGVVERGELVVFQGEARSNVGPYARLRLGLVALDLKRLCLHPPPAARKEQDFPFPQGLVVAGGEDFERGVRGTQPLRPRLGVAEGLQQHLVQAHEEIDALRHHPHEPHQLHQLLEAFREDGARGRGAHEGSGSIPEMPRRGVHHVTAPNERAVPRRSEEVPHGQAPHRVLRRIVVQVRAD
mmetsp:Transcript_54194/g.171990  ORF Transcript_54194/g.171990 Transcript_54194/m.171990 type:complete len:314 (-) Transcript_54194:545-1486(-)